jgi:hypothetical protein
VKSLKEKLTLPVTVLFCVLAAMALCMSFAQPELSSAAKDSLILNVMENLRLSLDGTTVLTSFVATALFFLWRYNRQHSDRRYVLLPIVCFCLAVVWLMSQGFAADNTLQSLTSSYGQMFKSLIYLLGSAWFLTQLGIAFDIFIENRYDLKPATSKLGAFWQRHSFLCPTVLILLSCILPVILVYPGGMCADSWCQAGMYFHVVRPDYGLYEFTSHHPPAHTVLFSSIIALGQKLGSANGGLFAVIIVQSVIHSVTFGYLIHTLKTLGAPRFLRILLLVVIMFSPFYVTLYPMVIKDNMYSWALVLFVIELTYMLHLGRDYWQSPRHIALLALSILMTILMRNNGIYVIYPMAALLVIIAIVKYRRSRTLAKIVLAIFVPIIAANLVQSALFSYYDIQKGSIREALSLPIQQTARYVLERGDEVTDEEKAAISAVLDYDNMAADYYPMESDPVKDAWNPEATTSDLINYLKTWAKMGVKHPFVYIKATLNQNYPLFYPFAECNKLTNGTISPAHAFAAETIGITDVDVLPRLNNVRDEFNNDLFYLPFTGILCSIPVSVIVLLFLCCYALSRKRWSFFIAALPLLLSLGIVVLSPGILGSPRYAYPIVFALPLALGYYYSLINKKT